MDLLELVDPTAQAAMLYGSHARGDSTSDSDVDLLEVRPEWHEHRSVERVSISAYTTDQLLRMAMAGSLFVLHLRDEGRVLSDPDGVLAKVLSEYRAPASYERLWREIAAASRALDASPAVLARNPEGFTRLALYLLRTAAIIRQLEQTGAARFAIPVLAERLALPGLAEIFRERETTARADTKRVPAARLLLESLVGEPLANPYGSLEALAVNTEVDHPIAAHLMLRLLAGEPNLGYGDLLLDPLMAGR